MTKADVIDILVDLQLEIEENVLADDPNTLLPFLKARETCVAVIQQKINKLKAECEKAEQEPCDKCAMKNSNSNYCENCMAAEYHGKKESLLRLSRTPQPKMGN